jgi:3-hydroxybutyryl-CoA dehydrogenase
MEMTIKKVGVLGCGLMGSGIAQVCAQAGCTTVVREVSETLLKKGLAGVERFLSRGVEKGKMEPAEKDAAMSHLSGTTALEDLGESDLIIEAIIENVDAKREVFEKLDRICPAEAIFASNTSSLPITEIMTVTGRRGRFVGLHFFNPVPLMNLVEVVRTIETDPSVIETVTAFARSLGKTPVQAHDRSGFIVNRLLVPYILDAIRALEEGVGSIEDIDTGMTLGCGHPMGPLTLLDLVGLDTTYYIANIMFEEFRERRFAPPPLLKRMVLAGYHGRKSGMGFYDYSSDTPKANDHIVR